LEFGDKTLNYDISVIRSVFHLTDFSEASGNAFAHALAIARFRHARLTIFHAAAGGLRGRSASQFPEVLRTLQRWGLLAADSSRRDVFARLSIQVKKVDIKRHNPVSAAEKYLQSHPTDLIVVATEGREGLPLWMRPSVGERLARRSETQTLFVPEGVRGFISLENGSTSLKRILVPVSHSPDPRPAVVYANRLIRGLAGKEIVLLHVGEGNKMPSFVPPSGQACPMSNVHRRGDVVEQILEVARELPADLIITSTKGRQGFLEAIQGGTTKRVLRQSPCPLIAVPAPTA